MSAVGRWTVEYQGRRMVGGGRGASATQKAVRLREDVTARSADDAARVCARLHGGTGHRVVARVQ